MTFSARYAHNNTRLDSQYGFTAGGALTPLREQYNTCIGVSVRLTTQRRSQGAIEAAAAGAASARLRREYLDSSIPLEVQSAYERWTAAMRTRDLLRDGVMGQSTKNLAVVREVYQLGQPRLLDVLNEQRPLLTPSFRISTPASASLGLWLILTGSREGYCHEGSSAFNGLRRDASVLQ